MAEPAKDQDQSMEDILQSIKRIIAEEGDPVEAAAASDVLELTEQLAEDGSISRVKSQPEMAPAAPPTMSLEEIMAAPISTAQEEPAAPPPPVPAPVVTPLAPEPKPIAVTPPAPPPAIVASDDSLLSNASLNASMAALNSLRDSMVHPAAVPRAQSATFRSGVTVEDLVIESLKPMLKEWLDANLPGMVEALVRKEISKLTQ